jgi:hypothetical protein
VNIIKGYEIVYIKMYNVFDNFLTNDELTFTENCFKKPIWEFGHGEVLRDAESSVARARNSPRNWFIAHLDHLLFFTEYLKEKIEKVIDLKCSLDKVYANGQTILNDGNWHIDNESSDYITALLYISDIDAQNIDEIKGHTEFKMGNHIISLQPMKNRLVVFESSIPHRGLAPNISGFLRISIAWKLKKITSKEVRN